MFTVNLEKKLIKENEEFLSNEEKRFVSFVKNTLQEKAEFDKGVLINAGFKQFFKDANEANKKNDLHELLKKKYGTKLFNVNQIKKLCLKYNLKFLPTEYYQGDIPHDLANKIFEYEETFENKKLNCWELEGQTIRPDGYYICAPASSFKLQEKPKDPLFFHKVSDSLDLYVLVHKWGNDLSLFNLLVGKFKTFRYLILTILSILIFSQAWSMVITEAPNLKFFTLVKLIIGFIILMYTLINLVDGNFYSRKWNQEFK